MITNALNIAPDAGRGAGLRGPHARRPVQGADPVVERRPGGRLFRGRSGREAVPRHGGRGARFRPDPAELRRSAAQAGDDPGRVARLSRAPIPPKINRSSFTRLGALDVIHSFITDDGIRDEDARAFESRGIKVIIAA